jgi:hypothetical protein
MTLAVVRNLTSARALRTAEEVEVFEQEIRATGGDVRRSVIGLSITAAVRYANTLEHSELADGEAGTRRVR